MKPSTTNFSTEAASPRSISSPKRPSQRPLAGLVHNVFRHVCRALVLALPIVAPPPSDAFDVDYGFTCVADSNGPVATFPTRDMWSATYAINDNGDPGTVAFAGGFDSGSQGVFITTVPQRDVAPAPHAVVDSTGGYASFGGVAINSDDAVLFRANLQSGGSGIFTGPTPASDTFVDTNGPYAIIHEVAQSDRGQIVFSARLDAGGEGIFTGPNPATDVVVDSRGPYSVFESVAINGSATIAFRAGLDGGGEGIFTGPNPATDTVADTFGDFFSVANPAINDQGTVVFNASLMVGSKGIFTGPNPATDTIADTLGPFADLGAPAINNNGSVAFWAKLDAGGEGIYTGPDLAANKVIATGDSLFGHTVTDLYFAAGLSPRERIAFRYQLDNGLTGVAIATPFIRVPGIEIDAAVNGLDVGPFVDALLSASHQIEADMNQDGVVNGLDIGPFVAAVVGDLRQIPEPSTLLLASLALAAIGTWRMSR